MLLNPDSPAPVVADPKTRKLLDAIAGDCYHARPLAAHISKRLGEQITTEIHKRRKYLADEEAGRRVMAEAKAIFDERLDAAVYEALAFALDNLADEAARDAVKTLPKASIYKPTGERPGPKSRPDATSVMLGLGVIVTAIRRVNPDWLSKSFIAHVWYSAINPIKPGAIERAREVYEGTETKEQRAVLSNFLKFLKRRGQGVDLDALITGNAGT